MHGWIPWTLQVATVIAVATAVRGTFLRGSRWWLPTSAGVGVAVAGTAYLWIRSAGIAEDPVPSAVWAWVGVSGAVGVLVFAGWRRNRWGHRGVSTLAVVSAMLCAAVSVNGWVGYVPTLGIGWAQLTAAPLPGETDRATVTAMQRTGTVPTKGSVVSVSIDASASGFGHRDELVYLPPAWFRSAPPPPLPAVMMIGGEFNTPADWVRVGHAIDTLDTFAAAHGGQSPVVVFVDSNGSFTVDTECVNGPRGNAADHLTKDVVPYLIDHFGVRADPAHWAVVGFSAGGTCAADLAVMHPELFGSFVDVAGDLRPNSGTTTETIDRLFGGSRAQWQAFDPSTVIKRHTPYHGLSGLFVVSGAGKDARGQLLPVHNPEFDAATTLCSLGAARGIDCGIIAVAGKHDWPCAAAAFATTLPWLASQIGTSGGDRPQPIRQQSGSVFSTAPSSPASAGR